MKHVDEVASFQYIQTAPLNDLRFSTVSMGTSHSAAITGETVQSGLINCSCSFFFKIYYF